MFTEGLLSEMHIGEQSAKPHVRSHFRHTLPCPPNTHTYFFTLTSVPLLQPPKTHGVFEDADQTINPTGALCALPTEFNVTTLLQASGEYIRK